MRHVSVKWKGGLDGMTIARFEQLVEASPLRLVELDAIPMRRLSLLQRKSTRELTTALVRAELAPRPEAGKRIQAAATSVVGPGSL